MVRMESSRSGGKQLWGVLRAVLYMLRKSLSTNRLIMDLHLLLKRGKTARKALGNFVSFNPHHLASAVAAPAALSAGLSCRSMDPDRAFYTPRPREVQFSFSSTPSHHSIKRSRRHHRHRRHEFNEAAVADALELVLADSEITEADPVPVVSSCPASQQLQIIPDSPCLLPTREEEEEGDEEDAHVDEDAEEFIKRFYEQLRLQQRFAVTPECRLPLMAGRA